METHTEGTEKETARLERSIAALRQELRREVDRLEESDKEHAQGRELLSQKLDRMPERMTGKMDEVMQAIARLEAKAE